MSISDGCVGCKHLEEEAGNEYCMNCQVVPNSIPTNYEAENSRHIVKTTSFNGEGQYVEIKIQLKYEDLEVLEYPESCVQCPVGFSRYNCGRNVPFASEDYRRRPSTCKLRKITLADIMRGAL